MLPLRVWTLNSDPNQSRSGGREGPLRFTTVRHTPPQVDSSEGRPSLTPRSISPPHPRSTRLSSNLHFYGEGTLCTVEGLVCYGAGSVDNRKTGPEIERKEGEEGRVQILVEDSVETRRTILESGKDESLPSRWTP